MIPPLGEQVRICRPLVSRANRRPRDVKLCLWPSTPTCTKGPEAPLGKVYSVIFRPVFIMLQWVSCEHDTKLKNVAKYWQIGPKSFAWMATLTEDWWNTMTFPHKYLFPQRPPLLGSRCGSRQGSTTSQPRNQALGFCNSDYCINLPIRRWLLYIDFIWKKK